MAVRVAASLVLAAILLSACVPEHPGQPGSPLAISAENDLQLRGESTINLCGAYWFYPEEKIRVELARREAVAPEDWPLIARSEIRVGMTLCGLRASWGPPTNVTVNVSGKREIVEYIYQSGGKQRVYLERDVITGFRVKS